MVDAATAEPFFIVCDHCDETISDAAPMACTKCYCVYYCSDECRISHRAAHEEVCKRLEARSREEAKRVKAPSVKVFRSDSGDSAVCGICFREDAAASFVALPACGHRFCNSCIERYREIVPTARCPMCRASLPTEDLLQTSYKSAVISTLRANSFPEGEERDKGFSDAMKDVDLLLEMDVTHRNLKLLKAELYYYQGAFRCAISWVQDYVEEKCIADKPIANYSEIASREYIFLAKCFMQLGENQSALAALRTALSHTKQDENSKLREILHRGSRCSYELGDYKEAIAQGELAIRLNRHFDGVYKYVALAHIALQDWDLAILTMRRAVAYETPWDSGNVSSLRSELSKTRLLATTPPRPEQAEEKQRNKAARMEPLGAEGERAEPDREDAPEPPGAGSLSLDV